MYTHPFFSPSFVSSLRRWIRDETTGTEFWPPVQAHRNDYVVCFNPLQTPSENPLTHTHPLSDFSSLPVNSATNNAQTQSEAVSR